MAISSRGKDTDLLKIFLNEVRVGSLPGIQQVGPKIYAWKVNRDSSGEIQSADYIMDDFTVAPVGHKVFMMKQYAKTMGACPAQGHPIYAKIKEAVLKFWRLTKGYHGDLHMGNMAVMINKKTKEPVKVIIFDYGSHKKFKANTGNSTCFEGFLRIIDKEFSNRYAKKTLNSRGYFPNFTKIRVAYPQRGQPLRPNTNLLRAMTLSGKYLPSNTVKKNVRKTGLLKAFGMNAGNKSIMTTMHPENQNLSKRGVNLKKANHQALFTTMNVLAKARANAGIRPGNKLLDLYAKAYPGKTRSEIRRAVVTSYANYNYNKYKRTGQLEFPNMNKAETDAMIMNVRKLTPSKRG
jgi:hypothetical protein